MPRAMRIIRSARGFTTQLDIGDAFWRMTSSGGKPGGIEGPYTIIGFSKDERCGFPIVTCAIWRGDVEEIEEHSINDITDREHGVFSNEPDAYQYFEEQMAKFGDAAEQIAAHFQARDGKDHPLKPTHDNSTRSRER